MESRSAVMVAAILRAPRLQASPHLLRVSVPPRQLLFSLVVRS